MMEEVDQFRLNYIKELIISLGYNDKEAAQRAFLLYSYLVTISLSDPNDWQPELFESDDEIFTLILPAL